MRIPCGSGLVSRKGCKAAPAIDASTLNPWGRYAPLSDRSDASARPLPQGARWLRNHGFLRESAAQSAGR
ncbi:hypothetical protein DMX06_18450 [Pseudomonas mosselii]|nr:hypothetical protein DMX06_18450 [Pseudomonas mosselii]